jgi:hypothetical protein
MDATSSQSGPVEPGSVVFRLVCEPAWHQLGKESQLRVLNGGSLPDFFILSSEDKKCDPPSFSVWHLAITTPTQGWNFTGRRPSLRLVMILDVDQVRQLPRLEKQSPEHADRLEVVWDPQGTSATGLGADGHCGIWNMNPKSKLARQIIRFQLSELASGPNLRLLSATEMV